MAKKPRPRPRAIPTDPLGQLEAIARNLWWSWNPNARQLFEHADPKTFAVSNQNPIVTLQRLSAATERALVADAWFVRSVRDVHAELRRYLRAPTWFAKKHGGRGRAKTAYFCMEYAVQESIPLYAGGLGVLAGDHLKSASDLGLPLVAVGIYWKKGYTRQHIDRSGRQTDAFPVLRPADTPLTEVCLSSGRPLRLRVSLGTGAVVARVWRLDVGRIPLYLLDTDLPANAPSDRRLTHVLYSGSRDTRIRQEILLGIGGHDCLNRLGIPVAAYHLNEGHAAFLSIERIRQRIGAHGETFAEAWRRVRNTSVFTTHTPVPAGNEEFDPALVDQYFRGYPRKLSLALEQFHDLARVKPGNVKENFGMTPLALRTSRYANGVAALHGRVARRMWKGLYPGKTLANVPIGHVTNGIHLATWLNPKMRRLLEEVLGPAWESTQDRPSVWARAKRIPDEALWSLHGELKNEMIAFCRQRLKMQLRRSPVPGLRVGDVDKVLSPQALTLGFARRFAPYKRATLVFADQDRLARILHGRGRPVQIIFAGKAHPADAEGKALIKQLVAYSRMPRFRRRIVFIEDYDMEIARHMVAGVDVWLDNPRRPREASGTSGMKPALHGGLNLSILDGWWPEGYSKKHGWAIGRAVDHDGTNAADRRDALALYRLLESEVVPLYFDRGNGGLPTRWIARMKAAIMAVPPVFNSHRQVKEYLRRYYLPAMRNA